MEWTAFRVDQAALPQILHVLQFVTIKTSRNVNSFAPDDDDSLSLQESLGDDGCEPTEEMAASIDDQRFGGESHLDTSIIKKPA